MIRTPRNRRVIPCAAMAIYASWPFMMAVYWGRVLNSGVLPTDADSIGIPIFWGFCVALFGAPFAAMTLWLTLRQRRGGASILSIPRGRSGVGWALFYVVIATESLLVVIDLVGSQFDGCLIAHEALALICLTCLHADAQSPRLRGADVVALSR